MRVELHLSLSELTALERCEKSAERARRMRIVILAMSGWTGLLRSRWPPVCRVVSARNGWLGLMSRA